MIRMILSLVRRHLAVSAMVALAAWTPAVRAEPLDQLYEKAKAEGALVFYAGDRLHRTRRGPSSSCRNTPASRCR